jgi:DNA-nicking Smr family endonuclease
MKDRELFLIAAEGVTPLKFEARAETGKAPAKRKHAAPEEGIVRDYLSDSISFPEEETAFCKPGLSGELKKLKRGKFPVEAELDLHGMRRDEARRSLLEFLEGAKGCKAVRIVHGKGYGSKGEPVLKAKVRSWLVQVPEVLAFCEAKPGEGGSGALIALLKTPVEMIE